MKRIKVKDEAVLKVIDQGNGRTAIVFSGRSRGTVATETIETAIAEWTTLALNNFGYKRVTLIRK